MKNESKSEKKLNIKLIVSIVVIIAIIAGAVCALNINKNKDNNVQNNNVQVQNNKQETEKNDVQVEDKVENTDENANSENVNENNSLSNENEKNTLEQPTYINIDTENVVSAIASTEEFSQEKNPTDKEYLKAVQTALENGYIKIDGKDTEFSKEDINNITYSIFGKTVKEFSSVDGLELKDGKYILTKGKEQESYEIKNYKADSGAGSVYATYDVYVKKDGKETLKGHYKTVMKKNTETDKLYAVSKEVSK